jgi:integrase
MWWASSLGNDPVRACVAASDNCAATQKGQGVEVHVHATRKTCASLLVALDVYPRVAMQILRHSQISVTMNIYSEVSLEETRKALKRLLEQLDS